MSMSAAVLNLFVWDKLITGMFYVSGVDGTSKNDVSNDEWDGFGTCAEHMLEAREAGMCLSRLQFCFFFRYFFAPFSIYIMTMLIVQFRVDWTRDLILLRG